MDNTTNKTFKPVDTRSSYSDMEKQIIKNWKKNKVFEASVQNRSQDNAYVFYDGPPFITGVPHHGTLLPSIIKDAVPRYWTMKGKRVERVWGWDCHGLPAENFTEKHLKIKNKQEIFDRVGLDDYIATCRRLTSEVGDSWEPIIDRIGRWVDFKGSYKTMDSNYMESVWWAFESLYKKGLIYEGEKILLYSIDWGTPISKSEVTMDGSYKDVVDPTLYVKFQDAQNPDLYYLAWTTTAWTLPANIALAVSPDLTYVKVRLPGQKETYIVASQVVEKVFLDEKNKLLDYEIIETIPGQKLINRRYNQYLPQKNIVQSAGQNQPYQILEGNFVTTEEGTGIVHLAPAFGQDDYELCQSYNLPFYINIDDYGYYTDGPWKGENILDSNKKIAKELLSQNKAFRIEYYKHSYPHNPRTGIKLIYKAHPSWFMDIKKIKDKMLEANKEINWIPQHFQHGRFENIVVTAPDWNLSRDRFWATPIPIWQCDRCNQRKVVGSYKELQELSGWKLDDYHLPQIDTLVWDCEACSQEINEEYDTVVAMSIFNEHGELLLCQKREDSPKKYIAGKWAGPGGHLEPGEKILDALKREIVEEIGVWPDKVNWIESELQTITDQKKIRAIIFSGFLKKDTPIKLQTDEHQNWRWVAPEELEELSIFPALQNITRVVDKKYCQEPIGLMKRIPKVMDCWFESGSMPFAQFHYPFENKQKFEDNFPGDFISEYVGQVRAWFYYLHAVALGLFGKPSFKNVIVTGVIAGNDGRKMSKSLGNFTDPLKLLDNYSADALRYLFLSSPLVNGEDFSLIDKDVADVQRKILGTLRNSYAFFVLYANLDGWNPSQKNQKQMNYDILDRWILSEMHQLISEVDQAMQEYDLMSATRPFMGFIDSLSNWYIRRNRKKFWKGELDQTKEAAYQTLWEILTTLSKLIAPFMPFIAEDIYTNLTDKTSVHLQDFPQADSSKIDLGLSKAMNQTRKIIEIGLSLRSQAAIKVRMPLSKIYINKHLDDYYIGLIKEELNVKEITDHYEENMIQKEHEGIKVGLDTNITKDLQQEGDMREIIRHIQNMRKNSDLKVEDRINLYYQGVEEIFTIFQEHIAAEVLATNVYNNSIKDPLNFKEITVESGQVQLSIEKVKK